MEENPKRAGRPIGSKTTPDAVERLLRAWRKAQRTGNWSRVRLMMMGDLAGLASRGCTRSQLVAWETLWRKVNEREAEATPPRVNPVQDKGGTTP